MEAGAQLKWVYDPDPDKVEQFREDIRKSKAASSEQEILQDPDVHLVAGAAVHVRAVRPGHAGDGRTARTTLRTKRRLRRWSNWSKPGKEPRRPAGNIWCITANGCMWKARFMPDNYRAGRDRPRRAGDRVRSASPECAVPAGLVFRAGQLRRHSVRYRQPSDSSNFCFMRAARTPGGAQQGGELPSPRISGAGGFRRCNACGR